jgi:hypothetical protein
LGAALTDVPLYDCPESLGQLQKVIFQRIESSTGVKNKFTSTNDISKLASWTAFVSATDGTKVVPSPYITNPSNEPGAARTYGGGNETLGGVEINIGREPTSFTGTLLQEHQDTIKALKELQCEGALGVYLVDESGTIAAIADNPTSPTTYSPIPIYGFFVGDKTLGGLEAPDSNSISWKFKPNWSDNLVLVHPDGWSPLTDIKKTTSSATNESK